MASYLLFLNVGQNMGAFRCQEIAYQMTDQKLAIATELEEVIFSLFYLLIVDFQSSPLLY